MRSENMKKLFIVDKSKVCWICLSIFSQLLSICCPNLISKGFKDLTFALIKIFSFETILLKDIQKNLYSDKLVELNFIQHLVIIVFSY